MTPGAGQERIASALARLAAGVGIDVCANCWLGQPSTYKVGICTLCGRPSPCFEVRTVSVVRGVDIAAVVDLPTVAAGPAARVTAAQAYDAQVSTDRSVDAPWRIDGDIVLDRDGRVVGHESSGPCGGAVFDIDTAAFIVRAVNAYTGHTE